MELNNTASRVFFRFIAFSPGGMVGKNLRSVDAKPMCFCGQRHEPHLGLFIKIVPKNIDICTRDRIEIWRAEKGVGYAGRKGNVN